MIDLNAAFERACRKPHEGRDFEALPESDRVLITIWALEGEVNNGGFDQFYFNSSGHLAAFAVEALTLIGAHQMAALVRDANAHFGPGGPPLDGDERHAQLLAITADHEDLFDDLDRRFFEYPDDVSALLSAYLERLSA